MPKNWTTPAEAPLEIDNSAYYQVILHGFCQLQAIVNILWYRVGFDIVPGDFNLYGAQHLADMVYDQVWKNSLQAAASLSYLLQDITVIPYNTNFDPVYNLPYVKGVNENGAAVGTLPGPAACITARFNLEPQVLGINGFLPPRRGFVAWGPYRELDCGDDGRLSLTAEEFYEEKLAMLAEDLSALPIPASWFPIRMRITRIPVIGLRLDGWTDIASVDVRPLSRYRRSRLPEA